MAMNGLSILILAGIAVWIALSIRYLYRTGRNGSCLTCGTCNGNCNACHSCEKKKSKNRC